MLCIDSSKFVQYETKKMGEKKKKTIDNGLQQEIENQMVMFTLYFLKHIFKLLYRPLLSIYSTNYFSHLPHKIETAH